MDQRISSNCAVPGPTDQPPSPTQSFLDYCRVGKGLSRNTLRAYAADLVDFSRTMKSPLQNTDRETLREYAKSLIDDRKLKATSVKRRLATLKLFFDWSEKESLIALSPFHRLDFPLKLPRRLPRALEADDVTRLLRRARSEAHDTEKKDYELLITHFVVVVLFTTGLRVGELASVTLENVSLTDGSIRVTGKGDRERRVFLTGTRALALLRQFCRSRRLIGGESSHLIVNPNGHPMTTQRLRILLRRVANRAGIKRRVTPHMLRHTAATQLLEAGVDIRFVQRLLGHASIATTQIYAHVNDLALKETLSRADTLRRVGWR